MTTSILQLQQQQHQTHERYISPPLEFLPEYQEQQNPHTQQQQYSAANLHNYNANVFTTPGTVATNASPVTFQEPLHATATATSANGIFENGKVCTILLFFLSFYLYDVLITNI